MTDARLVLRTVRRLPPPGDGFLVAAQTVTERGEALVLAVERRGADWVWSSDAMGPRRRADGTVAPRGRTVVGHVWRVAVIGDHAVRWHDVEDMDLAFPLIERLPDGRLVLAGSRMTLGEHGPQGSNACIVDPRHGTRVALTFGDAIAGLAVDALGRIWISYSDEGIYASVSAPEDTPVALSRHGLVCLDSTGEAVWRYPQSVVFIDDCYAMNVTGGTAWAFAYADFALIRIGEGFERKHWTTRMRGSSVIAVAGGHVLFGPQYEEPRSRFHLARLADEAALPVATVAVSLDDATPIENATVIARGGVLHAFAQGTWFRAPIMAIEGAAGRVLSPIS